MGYAALVGAIVGAGLSIIRGHRSRRQARRNARAVQQMARYNASMAIREARENSNRTMATAMFNSMVHSEAASVKSSLVMADASYNAKMNWLVGDYNAKLLERESKLLWQEHDLAKYLYQKNLERTTSSITSTFAASGIELGNAGEAPEVAVLDNQSQGALQLFIMKHGTDVKAKKLLESAAKSRWSAAVESNNIIAKGASQAIGTQTNANISSLGLMAQATVDADAMQRQGAFRANALLHGASWQASQYNRAGQQQFVNGLIGAVGQIGQGMARYYGSAKMSDSAEIIQPQPTSYQSGKLVNGQSLMSDYEAQYGNPMLWDDNK